MSEKTPELFYRAIEPDPARRREMDVHPRARFTKLATEALKHISATVARVERVDERKETFRTLRDQLKADLELSGLGRARKVRAAGDELLEMLAKEQQYVSIAEAAIREKLAKLTPVDRLDPGDVVSAFRDFEMRAHLRSLEGAKRQQLLAREGAQAMRDAALRGAPELSGMSRNAWDTLAARTLAERHGDDARKLDAETLAVGALRECVHLVREDVQRAVAAAEREATAPEKPAA